MTRYIRAYPATHVTCTSCEKNKCRRKDKSPAPIALVFGRNYEALCMTCAKRISAALDQAIDRIESVYTRNLKKGSKRL